jgi:Skp family chaperone for outer membrane proteins
MKNLTAAAVLVVAGVGVGVLATGVGSAGARSSSIAAPAAGVIATIDLEAVVEKLEERAAREAELKGELEGARKKLDALGEELKAEQSKLDMIKDESQRSVARKAAREKVLRAEIERQIMERQLVERQVGIIADLYKKIDRAAEELAKQNGYAMVLASDEKVDVPSEGDPAALRRAIALKRMLYVNPSMDVTDELITLMNNQWAASKK